MPRVSWSSAVALLWSALAAHLLEARHRPATLSPHAPDPKAKLPYTAARAEEMGEHLSLTEINSAEAERESVKIKLLEFFERELLKKTPTIFEAVITDTRPNGFFIELTESMTFGFVPASLLRDDYYQITGDGSSLVGAKTKKRYTIGAHLTVHVAKVDRVKRLMDFRPCEDAPAAKSQKKPGR
jgi:ribonuclease R